MFNLLFLLKHTTENCEKRISFLEYPSVEQQRNCALRLCWCSHQQIKFCAFGGAFTNELNHNTAKHEEYSFHKKTYCPGCKNG